MDTILMSQAFILYMCLQTTDTEGKRSKKTDKHNCFSGRRRQMIFWLKKFGHLMKEDIQVYILEVNIDYDNRKGRKIFGKTIENIRNYKIIKL